MNDIYINVLKELSSVKDKAGRELFNKTGNILLQELLSEQKPNIVIEDDIAYLQFIVSGTRLCYPIGDVMLSFESKKVEQDIIPEKSIKVEKKANSSQNKTIATDQKEKMSQDELKALRQKGDDVRALNLKETQSETGHAKKTKESEKIESIKSNDEKSPKEPLQKKKETSKRNNAEKLKLKGKVEQKSSEQLLKKADDFFGEDDDDDDFVDVESFLEDGIDSDTKEESEQKEAESEPLSMDDILMDSVRINVKDIKFSGKNDETSSVIVFPIEKNNSSNISVMVILRQKGRLQTFCSKLDATTKTLFINTNQHSFLVRGYLADGQFRAQIRGKNGTDICDEDQYKLTTEHIYTGIAKEGERGYFFREVKTFSKKFFLRCIPLSKKNNDSGTVPIACCIDEFQYGNGFSGDPTGKKRYCLCSDISPILFFDTEEDGMYQIIGKWTEKNQFLIEVQKENS